MDHYPGEHSSHRTAWLRHIWLPLVWLVGVLMILWGRDGRFDPLAVEYGANWPGDLRTALGQLTVEMLLLYAILRPWSYRTSWSRSLLALALVAPWAVVSFVVTMHAGRILGLLVFWRLLLVSALAITVIISSYTAWIHRRVAAT